MTPTLDFTHPPLSLLDAAQRQSFDRACDIVLFEQGARPLREGASSESVYFVLKGHAQAVRGAGADEQRLADYGPGDVLGAFAVIQGAARFTYEVSEDLLCHAVDAAAFKQALEANARFAAWFNEGLSAKRAIWQGAQPSSELAETMLTRVSEAQLAPAVWVTPQTTLREARRSMKQHGVSCVLVDRGAGEEPGIVTRTDVLDALALEDASPDAAVAGWVRSPILDVQTRDVLFQSLVKMTEHHVERVVVREGDSILGTLGMGEVLSHFSSHSHLIGLQMARADSVEAVQRAAQRVPELVRVLHAQGAKVSYLMELVSALNTRLFRRLHELIVPAAWQAQCCVLVLGSEGRREQILRSDQDNALIHPADMPGDLVVQVAERFTEALLGCGFPPCPGGIMLRNAAWRGDPQGWRARFEHMAQSRDPKLLLEFAILLDARAVAGDAELFDTLRPTLMQAARNDVLLHQFAAAALEFETPLTLFGRLRARDDQLDIKKGGIFPLVHGLRAMALRGGIFSRNSFDRTQALIASGALTDALGRDVQQAMAVFQRLRLTQQLDALRRGESASNLLHLVDLRRLDRELLRDALGVVETFKLALKQQFQL